MSSNDNGLISFTGPAGRRYYDRNGVLQTVGEDEIREGYDPLTGAYLGILLHADYIKNYIPDEIHNGEFPDVGENTQVNFIEGGGEGGTDALEIIMPDSTGTYARSSSYGGLPEGSYVLKGKMKTANSDGNSSYPGMAFLGGGTTAVAQREFSADWEEFEFSFDWVGGNFQINFDNSHSPNNTVEIVLCKLRIYKASESDLEYVSPGGLHLVRKDVGEDARFTNPGLFNNFVRGALVLKATPVGFGDRKGEHLIADGHSNRFIAQGDSGAEPGFMETFVFSDKGYVGGVKTSKIEPFCYTLSWSESNIVAGMNGDVFINENKRFPFVDSDILIADGWSGYIKSLDCNPKPYSEQQVRQSTIRDASAIIGECPNGGYYDYSDLSTMLIESDESGIPVEDRRIARVGDPIGAILDKSGHGNHMTASADDHRGVLRSNGDNYYIERGSNTVYGFDFSGDYSLTVMIALRNYSDRFIVLCNQDGGGGNHAMIYDASSTDAHLGWSNFGSPRYYVNGEFTPASNRSDTGATLQTNPIQLRTLHRVTDGYATRIFVGGYTSDSLDLTGNEYGFAWGSRLSEDDALIVEQEMRQNMFAIPN